ncbi:MAG: type II toxin-antitoxin system RelE/ParE family toxin [Pirellulales bacterium]
MTVHWTESALADLCAIEAYIGLRSARYAKSFAERIVARTEILAQHPQSGASVPEYDDPAIRQVLLSPYRIIYQILASEVHIVAVVHAARQFPPGE